MDSLIKPEDLLRALETAAPAWDRLQACYGLMAETECGCACPGTCCRFLPEMTFGEALQWVEVLRRLPPSRRVEVIQRFIEFYATCPLHSGGCPFLVEGRCSVYSRRPFACRAYGLWSTEMGRRRIRENRANREALIRQWKQYGVDLPLEKAQMEIDYCTDVGHGPSGAAGDEALMEILAKVYHLDRSFQTISAQFENHYHSDFSFLLAGMLLGDRKAVLGKFAVIKDLVRQQSNGRLELLLRQARPDRLFADFSL